VTMAYIRQHYGVPAKRGRRIRLSTPTHGPDEGTIVASCGQYLRVRFDGFQRIETVHPTWCVEYIDD
jgi:hypothetical protein